MAPTRESLGDRFASQPNALNFLRLLLASGVIVWHSYALAGRTYLPVPVERLMAELSVDSFFAISGFLICRAWQRNPQIGRFALARARRLLPGLWVCLVVTAFVIAPAGTAAAGREPLTFAGQLDFVIGNATTWVNAWGIDGGPVGVPYPGPWNGSLWSLSWEVCCYAGILVLGVAGLLRRRVMVGLAVVFWVASAALVQGGLTPTLVTVWVMPRTGLMFSCGALLWLYRDRIPVSRGLAVVAAALVPLGALTPNYRLIAAPAVAYLCLFLALKLGQHPRLVIRNDLSYGVYVYAFPVQQALLMAGLAGTWLSFMVLSFACVLPLAAASWFLVERPAGRIRLRAHRNVPALAEAKAGTSSR